MGPGTVIEYGGPMSESRSPSRDLTGGRSALASDRSIREARVTVDESAFDTIGIEELVSIWRDAGLRNVETLTCHETGAVVQVVVDQPLDPDRLTRLEYVDWWERVSNAGDKRRYVVEFTAPAFPPSIAGGKDGLLDTCNVTVNEHSITISLVGSQQAIADTISEYEIAGLSPNLRKLGRYGGRDGPLDTLTERQREVLETAYEMGYFEVPREVASEAIAAELDIDASTVTEHLQRAERNLLTQHLSARRSASSRG